MESANNDFEINKLKNRETFSVPLKIPGQTDTLASALKKYRTEMDLDDDSSKSDFLLFLLRQYLKSDPLSLKSHKLEIENKSLQDQNLQLQAQIDLLKKQLDEALRRTSLDLSSSEMQSFERAFQRRLNSKLSKSREDLIHLIFNFTRQRAVKRHLLND